jgi:hypothetical protein
MRNVDRPINNTKESFTEFCWVLADFFFLATIGFHFFSEFTFPGLAEFPFPFNLEYLLYKFLDSIYLLLFWSNNKVVVL